MWRSFRTVVLLCCGPFLIGWLRCETVAAQDPDGFAVVAAMEQVLVDAIAKAEESVVSIARIKRTSSAVQIDAMPMVPAFNRKLERVTDPDDPANPDFIPTDFGSGVIIGVDPPGAATQRAYILTNYHVVRGAAPTVNLDGIDADFQLFVRASGRKGRFATIFAADPRSDLAVIVIDDPDLKPIKLGDGAKLRKGQLVIALGNPYAAGRDGSASASWGMVSNITRRPGQPRNLTDPEQRQRETLHDLGDLIQVDTRLSLGTSGGALINLKGELVGLTMSLAALAGYEKSGGFAVPLDAQTLRAVQSLKEGKEVEYGFLGVIFPAPLEETRMLLTQPFATQETPPEGALVVGVVEAGPADRAGLQSGDIILSVNGERIAGRDDLTREINKLGPDARARLTIWRGLESTTNTVNLDVVLTKWGVQDEDGIIASNYRYPPWRGLVIDYSAARDKYNAEMRLNSGPIPPGVLLLKVLPPADPLQADLVAGCRITKVNKKIVSTPAEFQDAVKDLRGDVELELYLGKDANSGKSIIKQVTIHE